MTKFEVGSYYYLEENDGHNDSCIGLCTSVTDHTIYFRVLRRTATGESIEDESFGVWRFTPNVSGKYNTIAKKLNEHDINFNIKLYIMQYENLIKSFFKNQDG